jgi:hypothetical protein
LRAFDTLPDLPGVYHRPAARAEGFPRVRTDVAGFVGVAGLAELRKARAVDDWRSYLAIYGEAAPPGAALHGAVRDFFANGGRRAWIVNVSPDTGGDPDLLLNDMLGIGRSPDPHGLELLLRQDEVSIVALPDFDAEREQASQAPPPALPPAASCFEDCAAIPARPPTGSAAPSAKTETSERLYDDERVLWAQRYVVERLLQTRWRWFAVLAPPPGFSAADAVRWKERLTGPVPDANVAALYWPWLLQQDKAGGPVRSRSPVGAVAGVFADVDVRFGPQQAPAGRPVVGAVGVQSQVEDEENEEAYAAGVNVLRPFAGEGVQLWGARTLQWPDRNSEGGALVFVNARRCLSAVERTAETLGRTLAFDPNNAVLRIRLHQLMTDYLLRVYRTGALAGDTPEDSFFVKVETVQDSPEGHLICSIGVALAAPAEFIVFRMGRGGGVSEQGGAA